MLGVRWRHLGRKPWAVDCLGLVILSLRAAGCAYADAPDRYGREPWDDQLRKGLRERLGPPVDDWRPGDVALFHNRLVHRSGFNPGPRHRYSVQVRFGDLLAPEMLARGWRNRRVDGFETFKTLHPDLIASEETP